MVTLQSCAVAIAIRLAASRDPDIAQISPGEALVHPGREITVSDDAHECLRFASAESRRLLGIGSQDDRGQGAPPTAGPDGAIPPTYCDQRQPAMWEGWHRDHANASHREHADDARMRFIRALPQEGRCSALELGCGQGRDAVEMAASGIEVYAIDRSHVAIDRAVKHAANADACVRLIRRDLAEPLPFDDAQFDGVYAHLALHYFNDKTTLAIVDEIGRTLKPGGVLYFTVRSVDDKLVKHHDAQRLDDGDSSQRRCFGGHVRRFFDVAFVTSLLVGWRVEDIREYVNYKSHTNPGHFIEVLARRPTPDDQVTNDFCALPARMQDANIIAL